MEVAKSVKAVSYTHLEGRTLIAFYPLTGRTHQLRVHAAHPEGLHLSLIHISSSVISEMRAAQNPVARISPTNKACSSLTESGMRFKP